MLYNEALIQEIRNANVQEGRCAFWWLGQMAFAVRTARHTFYYDLFLAERDDRLVPPPMRAQDVTNAELVFGTHDHDDHIDHETWRAVAAASPQAKFVLPGGLKESVSRTLGIDPGRMIGLSDGETATVDGVEIRAVAAAHEILNDKNENEIFVAKADGLTIVHTGDTCVYEGLLTKLRAVGPIDILILPINGRDGERLRRNCIGNMTYQEAVDLAGALKPRLAIPGHYDMFAGNTENPTRFADYMEVKYPGQRFWIGPHARRIDFPD